MGTRKRVGLMMPASDGTAEPDFQMVLGSRGVVVHSHRLWDLNDVGPEERFERMNGEIEAAARYLARVRLDAVAYCCTTGSFFKGPSWDREMLRLIEKSSGAPAFATTPSVVEALNHFGAKRLSVITPYPQWNNIKLREYMEAKGYQVLNVDSHPKPSSGSIPAYQQDPQEIVEFGVERCRPEADLLFCSCTDWRSMEAAEEMEGLTGKPVVTSNQATIWMVLRSLGVAEPVQGFGSLLRGLAPAPVR